MIRTAIAVCCALLSPASTALAAEPDDGLAHVETRGKGETHLILIPGLLCDWTVWESFMQRNGERYTMHAVTLAGFAGTEPPPEPETNDGTPWLDSAVESVATYIRENDLEDPYVIGHSLGGHVAFRMSYEHPDLVAGVVSVDGMSAMPLGPAPMEEARRAGMVNNTIGPNLLDATDEQWFAQFEQQGEIQMRDQQRYAEWVETFRKTPAKVGARYMVELMKSDVSDDLANAAVPILVLPADNEPQRQFLGGEAAVKRIWQRQIEHAPDDLVTMTFAPDSRHFIMFDKPEWFDESVREFVEGGAAQSE